MKSSLIQMGFASIVLIVAVVAYGITFREVGALQEESFLLAKEIESTQTKERRIARAEEVLDVVLTQQERIESRFVSADTLVEFLESLEEIENRTGAAVEVLSVGTDDGGENFNVSLTIEGSFGAVMKTVGAVNTLPVFLTLTQGSVDTILKQENDAAQWTGSLSYKIGKLP